jgi:hypothetical protein
MVGKPGASWAFPFIPNPKGYTPLEVAKDAVGIPVPKMVFGPIVFVIGFSDSVPEKERAWRMFRRARGILMLHQPTIPINPVMVTGYMTIALTILSGITKLVQEFARLVQKLSTLAKAVRKFWLTLRPAKTPTPKPAKAPQPVSSKAPKSKPRKTSKRNPRPKAPRH